MLEQLRRREGGIEYHGGVDGGEGDWSHQGGGLPIFSLSMTKKGFIKHLFLRKKARNIYYYCVDLAIVIMLKHFRNFIGYNPPFTPPSPPPLFPSLIPFVPVIYPSHNRTNALLSLFLFRKVYCIVFIS